MTSVETRDVREALAARFKLCAVDWLTIERSEHRTRIGKDMGKLIDFLYQTFGISTRQLKTPSGPAELDVLVSEVNSLAESADRPGAASEAERTVVWDALAAPCLNLARSNMTQKTIVAIRSVLGPGTTQLHHIFAELDPATIAARLHDMDGLKWNYINEASVEALNEIVQLRVDVTINVWKLYRWAKNEKSTQWIGAERPLKDALEFSFKRSLNEVRYTSRSYTVLTSCALLAGVSLHGPSQVYLQQEALQVVAAAPQGEDTLGVPMSRMSLDQIEGFEKMAIAAWTNVVGQHGLALLASRKAALAQIDNAIGESADSLDAEVRFDTIRLAQSELKERWKQTLSLIDAQLSIKAKVAVGARIWASQALIFRQLAGRTEHTTFKPVAWKAEQNYQNAISNLFREEHSLAFSHLARFGSHAISQRTAGRYDII